MEKSREQLAGVLPVLARMIVKIGLEWDFEIHFFSGETTVSVLTDVHRKKHQVNINTTGIRNRGVFHSLAHEFCHARMTEAIHPFFGTVKLDLGTGNDHRRYEEHYTMIMNGILDIWVEDMIAEIFPQMTDDGVKKSVDVVLNAVNTFRETRSYKNGLEIHALALRQQAFKRGLSLATLIHVQLLLSSTLVSHIRRSKKEFKLMEEDWFDYWLYVKWLVALTNVERGKKITVAQIKACTELLTDLPHLDPIKRARAMRMYTSTVQKICSLLDYPQLTISYKSTRNTPVLARKGIS